MSGGQSRHHWVIDVLEGSEASLEIEAGRTISVPASMLPAGARHGDVLRVTIEVDPAATRQALERSAETVRKGREMSRKIDPGGDVQL
jgi:hypothetical protein